MKRAVGTFLVLCTTFSATFALAQDRRKAVDRVKQAGTILDEIMAAPDQGIPSEILGSAECVAIVPSMLKGAFGIGGQYGRGVVSCKTKAGWSAPAFFSLKGGSFGLQIGGQAVDLIMVVTNPQGMQALLNTTVKLGVDVSAAAGPVGRQAAGDTDWKMKSEILSYSRARGVFAGVDLNGASVKQGNDETALLYGKVTPVNAILAGKVTPPAASKNFLATVRKYASAIVLTKRIGPWFLIPSSTGSFELF